MASEIYRERQYANFKPPRSERKHRNSRWREEREGMSETHLAAIRKLPCAVGGTGPVEAHHLKALTKERGMSVRSTDRWAVPLSHDEHMSVERAGTRNEIAWFKARGIEDPHGLAAALFAASPDLERMGKIIDAHRGE